MSTRYLAQGKRRIFIFVALLFVFGSLFPIQIVKATSIKSREISDLIYYDDISPTAFLQEEPEQEPKLELTTKMFDVKAQKRYLYLGGTTGKTQEFGLVIPKGAVLVDDFSTDLTEAFAQYVVRYGTSNPSVAGVTSDGVITAVKEGTCAIIAVVELIDGEYRVFERTIVVKRASIEFIDFTEELKVGEQFTFRIQLNGYCPSDVKWMTTHKNGAIVGKNRGSLTAVVKAVTEKTDGISIQVGEIVYSLRIKIKK